MSIIATVLQLHPDLLQGILAHCSHLREQEAALPQGSGARWAKGSTKKNWPMFWGDIGHLG